MNGEPTAAKRDEAGFLATPEFRLAPPLMPAASRGELH